MTLPTTLLDLLSQFPSEKYSGEVFRTTRQSLDPLAPSTSGGRWAPRNGCPVLYSSLEQEGALAEISYYLGQLSPLPYKLIMLHRLKTSLQKPLRLLRTDLATLGVDMERYGEKEYRRTQEIGVAAEFLEYDGLIVPSARWPCDNLILFTDNLSAASIEVVGSEPIEWQTWARANGLLDESPLV